MNSDTRETATDLAKQAGAIIQCPICFEYEVSAGDEAAHKKAYALATNAWKSEVRGFRGMDRQQVVDLMQTTLDGAADCPRCSHAMRSV